MAAWSVKTRRGRSVLAWYSRDARGCGHTTTTIHGNDHTPPLSSHIVRGGLYPVLIFVLSIVFLYLGCLFFCLSVCLYVRLSVRLYYLSVCLPCLVVLVSVPISRRAVPSVCVILYKIRTVGHSLGAGCAALLSLLLQADYPSVRALAVSPPGGLVSEGACREVAEKPSRGLQ